MPRPRLLSLALHPRHELLVVRILARDRAALSERTTELRNQALAVTACLGVRYVLFDLAAVVYLSNLLFSPMLLVARSVGRDLGGAVLVSNLYPEGREYLQLVRLDRIFHLCSDEAAAVAQVEAFQAGREVPFRWPQRPSS